MASRVHQYFSAVCAALSLFAAAATVSVDLDVRTKSVENDPASQRKNVAIFVLDRSGSMLWGPANGGAARNRNVLLQESVRERIRTIAENEPNTEIYLLSFSDSIRKIEGPHAVRTPSQVSSLISWKGFDDSACHGQTLLYDAQAKALDLAEKIFQENPGVKVRMFVYSDGENETPSSGQFVDENLESGFFGSRRVKVRFPSKARCSEAERAKAARDFRNAYAEKVASYVREKKIEQHWGWLGAGNPPEGIQATKDEYVVGFSSGAPALKNPASVPSQTIPATVVVPLPEKYVKDLDGLSATIVLDMAGRRVAGKLVSLKPGRRTVEFQVPDGIKSGAFGGRLALTDLPDAWDKVSLRTPSPIELTFSAPDAISFLSVSPSSDAYVRAGDAVSFTAKASDSADIEWTVGGQVFQEASFSRQYDRAGDLTVRVKASRKGFSPAVRNFSIHVIDTSLAVRCATAKPVVGDGVSFEAVTKGRPENYVWWVDGRPVEGASAKLPAQVFERSGRHVVKARAYFGHGLSADSDEVAFDVAARPCVVISDPFGGSEYAFGDKIECRATVEGDFDKVVWRLSGPATEELESAVDKEGRASRPVTFKPAKGGDYTLTATAHGAAGVLQAKTPVRLKVARENLGVAIVAPASGATVGVGKGVAPVELKAEVKGSAIKAVKWTVHNRKTGKTTVIRTTPVQDGVSSCSYQPADSVGNGVALVVQAEAVMDSNADAVVSAPIELISSLIAELNIDAKLDGADANGREVKFGSQITLTAQCKGAVDPDQVQWFAWVDGKERPIGTGPRCSSPREQPAGENLRTVRYFARYALPDGSVKESRRVIVHHYCPDISMAVKLPCGSDGIARTLFGINEPVSLGLTLPEGEVADVRWNIAGKTVEGPVVNDFLFPEQGEYLIQATGRCKVCGKKYATEAIKVNVRVVPPKAAFDVVENGTYYTVRGKLHLRARTGGEYGDITNFTWFVNGARLEAYEGKREAVVELPRHPCELTLGLTVEGPKGTEPDSAETREVRVRYGWWAAVPAVLVLLLLVYFAFRLLLGNGPRRWEFYTWEGPAPKLVNGGYPDELGDAYLTKGVPLSGIARWNYWSKRGRLRLSDMLMLECAEGSPWTAFAEDEFEVRASNGTPIVRPPEGKFDDITGEVNLTGEAPYFLFRYIGVDYADELAKGHDYLRLRVVNESAGGLLSGVLFLLVFALLIWGFVWACLTFAI